MSRDPAQIAAKLAPTGVLRCSINLGNPILAAYDEVADRLSGITVDLALEIGKRLGLEVRLERFRSAASALAAVGSGDVDIGFLAVDPDRVDEVTFSEPYLGIDACYLVALGSPIRSNEEVDRAGVTIAVGKGSAYDLHLTRALKHAAVRRSSTPQSVFDDFVSEGTDVLAGLRHQLAGKTGDGAAFRLLPGRFMSIRQAVAVRPAVGDEAIDFIHDFVREAKASSLIHAMAVRNGIDGAVEID